MYRDLNGKFEALNTHMKLLETQVAQASTRNIAPLGTLPGKSEVNPRAHCNVIFALESEDTEETRYNGNFDSVNDRPIHGEGNDRSVSHLDRSASVGMIDPGPTEEKMLMLLDLSEFLYQEPIILLCHNI